MKKILKSILALLLCLILFSASALAEPLPWLKPWMPEAEEAAAKGTRIRMQFSLQPEAWCLLLDPYFDTSISPITIDGMDEEQAAYFMEMIKATIESEKKMMKSYLAAVAALAKDAEIELLHAAGALQLSLSIQDDKLFTIAELLTENDEILQVSDLHPSYALLYTAPEASEEEAPADSADELLLFMEKALSRMPEFLHYHWLQEQLNANLMELDALLEKGYAVQEGDIIRYTGTLDEVEALAEEMNLVYDPLYEEFTAGMEEFLSLLFGSEESETEEETEEAPEQFIYERIGNSTREQLLGETYTYTVTTENQSGGSTLLSQSTATWQEKTEIFIQPDHMTFEQVSGPEDRTVLTVDASENQILAQLDMYSTEQLHVTANLELKRTEEGQNIAFSMALPMTVFSADGDVSFASLPVIRAEMNLKNDPLKDTLITLSVQGEDQFLPLFSLSLQGEAMEEAPEILSADGKTTILPNSKTGAFDDEGYLKELRTVTAPRLNLWVLTKLPMEARPLLSPLLSLISQLGQ